MIVTVTINPLLERRLSYDSVSLGGNHRTDSETFTAGGKGINVSRQLKKYGCSSLIYTFAGGKKGRIITASMKEEELDFTVSRTKAESREATVVTDKNAEQVTTFFGPNTTVSEKEVDEFLERLDKMIENCEIVVFSGSSPCKETDRIFEHGIKKANEFGKISVLDTYGDHLKAALEASPTVFHANRDEIEKSLSIDLSDEEKIRRFMSECYKKNIKQIYITDGGKPFYIANFDFHYKVTPPKVSVKDPTGSGDAFVAGIVYGWFEDLVFDEFLPQATALGAANAGKLSVCNVEPEEIKELQKQVRVETVGKKMKIVDVTPTNT